MSRADEYGLWLDPYEAAYADPAALVSLACPACAERDLRLAFVEPDAGGLRASAVFWCASCCRGVVLGRAPVSVRHRALVAESPEIPDFVLVAPSADAGEALG